MSATNYQFYRTHPEAIEQVVAAANITNQCTVLEPSAGEGHLVDAVLWRYPRRVVAVELCEVRHQILRQRYAHRFDVHTVCHDFLQTAWTDRFDRVVMNPPFNTEDGCPGEAAHVLHAYAAALKPGGVLTAIVTPRFLTAAHDEPPLNHRIRELVAGVFTPLPHNDAVGATRQTVLIRLEKPHAP